jgi:hypothetical protein
MQTYFSELFLEDLAANLATLGVGLLDLWGPCRICERFL